MKPEKQIFKNGSTTYYWSSKFFPEDTRDDVFKFYSFVRIADDFVDQTPQDKTHFKQLEDAWRKTLATGTPPSQKAHSSVRLAVSNMHDVYKKHQLDPAWIDAFLAAMRSDLSVTAYATMKQTRGYMYGSAEVIGLIMAKIIGVKEQGFAAAQAQGRAMQYINFIRDIAEDNTLGRRYLPASELKKYGLPGLSYKDAIKHPAAFKEFIEAQLRYYYEWQNEASKGFKYIPRAQRVALRTAVDMYNWTAQTIAKNPFMVFDKKVKPSKARVVVRAIVRSIHA